MATRGWQSLPCEASRNAAFRSLEDLYVELAKAIGGSIRVKRRGRHTDSFLHLLITFFFCLLTWAEDVAWLTPLVCVVVCIVIRALMVLGDDLEDPFSTAVLCWWRARLCWSRVQ